MRRAGRVVSSTPFFADSSSTVQLLYLGLPVLLDLYR